MFAPSRRAVFPAVAKGFCILPLKVDRKPKPSLLKELKKLKDEIAKTPRRVKERFKEKSR